MTEKIDIKVIEEKLKERLYYQNEKDETYYSERKKINDKYPDEGWYSLSLNSLNGQELNKLEQKKHWDIRTRLKDDKGFDEIKEKLPDIKIMITEKEGELELLNVPKSSNVLQRAYTRVTGIKNTADIKQEEFDKKKKSLDSELRTLETIKHNIQKLIPIYEANNLNELYNTPTIVVKNATHVNPIKILQNKPIENKRGVMVRAENMVIGNKYKLTNDDIVKIVTLTNKTPFRGAELGNRESMGTITFSNGEKYTEYADVEYEEVAQEGGKRKTRRQRKSRKARRRQTNRRR